ncbi:MAG: HDIG domain-containing protein [Gemmatimonadetes bacterium]|nr:HDIG domain-containing protein [Gemmatimonadota bacterium]MCY3943958.1 HDIG domain-containing protein [Gemmatimonadota bacterium]
MPTRSDAVALLEEWVESEALRRHMHAVEAAVRHYARLMGGDEELWGLAGLLHDLDWERHPDQHPHVGVARLRELGYPDEVVRAVLSHGYPQCTDVRPETPLERVLYACDELSGLVYACCLVRPNGIDDLKPKSVVRKMKDKAFARGVHREAVHLGVELIGLPRAEHIQNVIDGLRTVADVLEVRGVDQARRREGRPDAPS